MPRKSEAIKEPITMKRGWVFFYMGVLFAMGCCVFGLQTMAAKGTQARYELEFRADTVAISTGYSGGAAGLGIASGACFIAAAIMWRKP